MTKDEYKQFLGFNDIQLNNNDCDIMSEHIDNDYNEFNWVKQNKITSVKNQLECGSCWAFSTIGAYENWYAINYNELIDFSEQELVDCDRNDNGCNGGLMINGLHYIKNNGICKYDDYKYNGIKSWECHNNCKKYPKINGCYSVPSNNNKLLRYALLQNAVTVAIEADNPYFQHYSSGIIDDPIKCGNNVDHGVLLVGYGEENGKKYWLIKNSWSSDWGDNGYVKILRYDDNDNNDSGVCGILTMPSYPY
jgi:C1A family cysteine protease